MTINPTSLGKIVNPEFAMAVLHGYEPHGEFKAYVRMADQSDDVLVSIRCDQIEKIVDDSNVLSVELREYVS